MNALCLLAVLGAIGSGLLVTRWMPQAELCAAMHERIDLPGARLYPVEWREQDAVAQVAFEYRQPRWRTRACLDERLVRYLP